MFKVEGIRSITVKTSGHYNNICKFIALNIVNDISVYISQIKDILIKIVLSIRQSVNAKNFCNEEKASQPVLLKVW